MPTTSRFAIATSTLESVGLVLIGVIASQLHELWAVVTLIVIAALIGLGRYLAAAPARTQEAREWLASYLEDPADLEEVLRELSSHIDKDIWTRTDMVKAIDWWINEDLHTEWLTELDSLEGQRRARQVSRWRSVKLALRHPIRALQGKMRQVERNIAAASELRLLRVVARLPEREVARIVTAAGVEAEFLEQAFTESHRGYRSLAHRLLLPERFVSGDE